ncbi:MBL fold metallo-hydrolase [Thermodesulfobacteriota bacterium]
METPKNDQIIRVKTGSSNCYLVVNGLQTILIDAGLKNNEQKILDALHSIGLSPKDVKLIILTHTHYDHCGSLKALKNITNAKIVVHVAEAECLEQGYCEIPRGTMWFSKLLSQVGRALGKRIGKYPSTTPDILIKDKFDLHDYGIDGYIIPTPGHTKGSMSIIIGDRYAIVGDTLFNIFRNSVFPPFADDQETLLRSWKTLIDIGCEYYYPGHGDLFRKDRFKRIYEVKTETC